MASGALDISSLNDEQQSALQQYTAVTDQDLEAAIALLTKCQWNVQIAVTRFFDGDAGLIDPAVEAAQTATPPSTSNRRAETLIDSIPRSSRMQRSPAGLQVAPRVVPVPESQISQPMPFPFNLFLLPVNLTYIIIQRIFSTIGYVLPFLPRLLARFWSGRASRPTRDTGRTPLNPKDTAARFTREFEEEYGSAAGRLPFFQGGYANAFDAAKRELKFLLVVLLSSEHDDTASFVQQTLLSPEFTSFLQTQESKDSIILWGGTVQDAEAYQVAGALNATKFPFTCLIVHTPAVSPTAMSRITTASAPISARELIDKLQAGMTAHTSELDRVRRQRAEQQASRNLRQEQESAYERSLAQDREKARIRKAEEAARSRREKEEQDREYRKAEVARKLAQWRQWRAQSLPPEPSGTEKEAVRVSIRLKTGERLIRRFLPEADLEELYAYIECHELVREASEVSEEQVPKPDDYEHSYKFRVVSPMPRQVYDLANGGSLRDSIGRNGNLIVEPLLDDDDDDDEDDGDDEHDNDSRKGYTS